MKKPLARCAYVTCLTLGFVVNFGCGGTSSPSQHAAATSSTITQTASEATPTGATDAASTAAPTAGGSYVLLGWSELGMHCMDGKDYSIFSVLPPYNTIYAKLLKKGSQPAPVTSGVVITYEAIADSTGSINTISSSKTNFWSYVQPLFLGSPPPDVGLHTYRTQSRTPRAMAFNTSRKLWAAEGVPTVPYDDAGKVNAYPMVKLVAKTTSGTVLAQTTVVLAVSDEMSCKNCHASGSDPAAMPPSGWVKNADPAKDVKLNILKLHDSKVVISTSMLNDLSHKGYSYESSLYNTATGGTPVLCAACHQSVALDAAGMSTGVSGVPALTSSMHTKHGPVVNPATGTTLDNATSPQAGCYLCHPGVNTKCQRGAMQKTACYDCHGNLTLVGKSSRTGWLDEPACQMCHQNSTRYATTFSSPGVWRTSSDSRFATNKDVPMAGKSLYRFSQGHGGVDCSGCHGAQHAEFPTNRLNDNVSSVYLQGYAGKITECTVCHTTAPSTVAGGPHGMHTVGQSWVQSHPDLVERSGPAQCAYCHGSDYRGSPLSKLLAQKTFTVDDGRTKTFAAGTQIGCYSCHNGPNGG